MKVKMMEKSRKNRVIFFDNSTIQTLYLNPEDFGNRNNKIINFEFSDKDGSEYLDGLKLQYMKDTHKKFC